MLHLPGLNVSIGNLAQTWHRPESSHLVVDSFSGRNISGLIKRHPNNPAAGVVFDANRKAGLAIDASPDLLIRNKKATPIKVFQSLLQQGRNCVSDIDGQFLLVMWDDLKGTVLLASDRFGLRPHYIRHSGDTWLVGPSAQDLARHEGRALKIDQRWIYAMLSYSRVSPERITCFEGYEALAPATLVEWHHQSLIGDSPYWDYFQGSASINKESLFDECAHALRLGVENSFSTGLPTGICLSGGLDSRLILAAMPEATRKQTTAFTWGAKRQSCEVSIAAQTALHFGLDWRFIQIDPADFVKDLEEAVCVIEGRDHAIQGYAREAFKHVARTCEAASSGLALDILASGSYSSFLVNNPIMNLSFEKARDSILDRYRYFNCPAGEMFRYPKDADASIEEIKEKLCQDFGHNDLDLQNLLDRFVLRQRGWRQLFSRQQWQRLFVEDVTPTFSNRLIELLCSIHPKERAYYGVSRQLIRRLAPSSLTIPYQRTLLPVSAPVELWAAAAEIEGKKESLYRQIFHSTAGAVFIPYDRYYSNFDEWQRTEPSWIETLKRLLLSSDSRLTTRYIRHEWMTQLIEKQLSGARANYAQINVLISLEHLLRRFG